MQLSEEDFFDLVYKPIQESYQKKLIVLDSCKCEDFDFIKDFLDIYNSNLIKIVDFARNKFILCDDPLQLEFYVYMVEAMIYFNNNIYISLIKKYFKKEN